MRALGDHLPELARQTLLLPQLWRSALRNTRQVIDQPARYECPGDQSAYSLDGPVPSATAAYSEPQSLSEKKADGGRRRAKRR
jgi:hypothetical protein